MAAPKKSPRPKPNPNRSRDFEEDRTGRGTMTPRSGSSPKTSPRPKARPDRMAMGGPVKGYAKGGKCRGMGAAKRGGDYKAM